MIKDQEKGDICKREGTKKRLFAGRRREKDRTKQYTVRALSFCQPVTLCHPDRLRIAYFDPKERPMKKNEMQKGFLSHSQYDSEIFTKILEEKQGKMPTSEE